jgi:hypothetical protein
MADAESSEDDDNPLSDLPEGYSVFELNDGWPPANRYAEPSLVATPSVPRPKLVTSIPEAISEELAGEVDCASLHSEHSIFSALLIACR